MKDSIDSVLKKLQLDLKILSKYGDYPLETHVKLCFDHEDVPYCHEETFFTGLFRMFNGDSRKKILRFVERVSENCQLILLIDHTKYSTLLCADIKLAIKGIDRLSRIYKDSNISEKFKLQEDFLNELIS